MRLFNRPTILESITLIAIIVILAALFLIPDSATNTRRNLERRVRDWKRTLAPTLSDASLIATDVSLVGEWACRRHLSGTTFTFSARTDQKYNALFSTGGCLGGCELSRVGTLTAGVLVLDDAVAEYSSPTYDTLYTIRIDNAEYLLPAESVSDFERERETGSDKWKWYVHSRVEEPDKPTDKPE